MPYPFEVSGSGFPVVLLHAFPLSSSMWRANSESITDAGFRVVAPDFPGFGRNTSFSHVTSMDEMATGVRETIASLGIGRAVFVGLSMGGYVLLRILERAPSMIAGIVLADTTAASDTAEKTEARKDLVKRVSSGGSSVLAAEMLPNLLSAATYAENPRLVEELSAEISGCDPGAACAALRGMAERPDSRFLLGGIGVPVLLLFGKDDKVTNLDAAAEMANSIPGSTLSVLERAGHYSNLERPSEFDHHLISFLNSLRLNN